MSNQNFQKLKELGKGSFSTVYKVRRTTDNKEYAMKVVKITQLSEKERQNALNEIRILASIADPNIIGYKEAFFDESNRCLCIIMEFADGGDLTHKIAEKKIQRAMFTEKEIWRYLIQMTKGLRSLHNLKILHRDLKCANIFLTKEGILKLGDLNVSKITQKGLAITQAGTPYYCAPEIWKGNVYDKKCDIWSLGCVLYEITAFKPPFRGNGMKDLYQRIVKGEFERIPKCYSNELSDLIRSCLKLNPNERPSCDEILGHGIVKNSFSEELGADRYKSAISKAQLLNTIKLPKNLGCLKEKLPKPNYNVVNKSFDEEEELTQNQRTFFRCPSDTDLKEKKNKDIIFDDKKSKEKFKKNEILRPASPLIVNEVNKYHKNVINQKIENNKIIEKKYYDYEEKIPLKARPLPDKNVKIIEDKKDKNKKFELDYKKYDFDEKPIINKPIMPERIKEIKKNDLDYEYINKNKYLNKKDIPIEIKENKKPPIPITKPDPRKVNIRPNTPKEVKKIVSSKNLNEKRPSSHQENKRNYNNVVSKDIISKKPIGKEIIKGLEGKNEVLEKKKLANQRLEEEYRQVKQQHALLVNKENVVKRYPGIEKYYPIGKNNK